MRYQIAKGVFDILPNSQDPEDRWRDVHLWQHVEETAREIAAEYCFQEIRTPLFETTDLFSRSIGGATDIVVKEMYTFNDKGGRSLTLRPEGTAPVMRAFIEKHLDQLKPVHKFFYFFQMFRYERQQAGRYRQHHQFGAEAIGNASPFQDAEIIDLLYSFLSRLGLKGLHLQINSLGSEGTRKHYRHELKMYLRKYFNALSEDSKKRYETNPLRILDSKHPEDQPIIQEAPSILACLDDSSKLHFETLCTLLKEMRIPFRVNANLVRGLDYYTQTVFEITSEELGAQNSLGGGGRYDGLIKELGGPNLPACGFGIGLERVIQSMLGQSVPFPPQPRPKVFLIPLGEPARLKCLELLHALRCARIPSDMEMENRKMKQAMRLAVKCRAQFVIVLGEFEMEREILELKDMESGHTEAVPIHIEALTRRLSND